MQVTTTYWSSLPNGTFYPMFIVATLSAIIASQVCLTLLLAMILGALIVFAASLGLLCCRQDVKFQDPHAAGL